MNIENYKCKGLVGRICLAVCLSAIMLAVWLTPVASYGDAAIETFWELAYEVDYDVYVAAPDGGVNLRYGAGTEYGIMLDGLIPNGERLHIIFETKAANGKTWGCTEYDGYQGWVFLGHCSKSKPVVTQNQEPDVQQQTEQPQQETTVQAETDQPVQNTEPAQNNAQPADPSQQNEGQNQGNVGQGDDSSDSAVDGQNSEQDQAQAPVDEGGEDESAPTYMTPLMLVIIGLLIIVAVLLAIILLKMSRKK